MCVQQRLRSACASAQSDQSLRYPHEEMFSPWLSLKQHVKTLIRLGDAQVDLNLRMADCWFCRAVAHFVFLRGEGVHGLGHGGM